MKTSVFVRSDPSLLERIVRNLLTNAVRYTDRGELLLGCRRCADKLRIEVWDTGQGIPADKHREIFREFAQLDCVDHDRHKGLGLGLAIVERLARLLDHDVQLRSIEGKGSVFAVSVPRGREEDFIANPAVEFTTAFDLTGVLILVIDAEPAVCQAMETLLAKWNCDVITARSGADMKDKLAALQRVPDLIIADCQQREAVTAVAFRQPTGDQLGANAVAASSVAIVEMLRAEFNTEIPALLLTGDTGPDRPRDLAGGALPVLRKPLNPARLRTLIANLLRINESQERPRRAS